MNGKEALQKLLDGNEKYQKAEQSAMDVSGRKRSFLVKNGQSPIAAVVTCADSRVVPEAIFSSGLGELFVIREAGNVIGGQELGSIEYAIAHLGISCVVVLGHDACGAVAAALEGSTDGFIGTLVKEIRLAIGEEKDPDQASKRNVHYQVKKLLDEKEALRRNDHDILIVGGLYHQLTGEVEILEQHTILPC